MKEVIYLTVNRNKVEKMTKTLTDVRKGEIVVKLTVNVKDKCFGNATIPQEIFIDDWRDGIDMEDVEFKKNLITKDEAELIKEKRLDKMTQILKEQGYEVFKPEELEQ